MKIAIDTSPLNSLHKLRGIGSYTQNLVNELKRINTDIEFLFFDAKLLPQADIIHYPYFDLFFHTLPIVKRSKTIVTIHDVIPLVYPEHFPSGIRGNINLLLQKIALKNIDAIITDSKASKSDIQKILKVPHHKVHTIYLAASNDFKKLNTQYNFANIIKKYKLPEKFVLYVGDLNWNKNITNLLKAIKIANIPLVCVGEAFLNASLKEVVQINKQIEQLQLAGKVFFTGYVKVEELNVIYNIAQLTVLPSHYEGFGLPIAESMACGTPVVCANNSSQAEVGGNVAIYCNPQDPADIAHKIKNALTLTINEQEKIIKDCIAQAAKFSWEKTAKETIKIYKILASL